jgi:hypothetical protein
MIFCWGFCIRKACAARAGMGWARARRRIARPGAGAGLPLPGLRGGVQPVHRHGLGGDGTMANDRPPIQGVVGHESGQIRLMISRFI